MSEQPTMRRLVIFVIMIAVGFFVLTALVGGWLVITFPDTSAQPDTLAQKVPPLADFTIDPEIPMEPWVRQRITDSDQFKRKVAAAVELRVPGHLQDWELEVLRLQEIVDAIRDRQTGLEQSAHLPYFKAVVYQRLARALFVRSQSKGNVEVEMMFDKAEEAIRQAKLPSGVNHNELHADNFTERAGNLVCLKRAREALPFLQRALELAQDSPLKNTVGELYIRNSLTLVLFRANQLPAAVEVIEPALGIIVNHVDDKVKKQASSINLTTTVTLNAALTARQRERPNKEKDVLLIRALKSHAALLEQLHKPKEAAERRAQAAQLQTAEN